MTDNMDLAPARPFGMALPTPLLLTDAQGLDILSIDECQELLRQNTAGRVGFVSEGQPVILPVNYAFVAESILFRTAPGSKLGAARRNERVAFEVDDWSESTRTGWSVLAKGIAQEVSDEWQVALCEHFDVEPWADQVPRDHWVRIEIVELTGRFLFRDTTEAARESKY